MSDDIIISARNLTKTYRAYAHPLDRLLGGILSGRAKRCKEFHALNDVSFDIKRGETFGIIGRNGSGKSTLLQLICGIRKPTSGTLQVNGRISALLELGAGFHPEFTGRENVFLQGAIQGMSRQEMEARFDDIAAFADIGEYIDQPVKTYSSGMFVRLAFAVAVSVEPDILVVDEALAVGDASFRSRCFRRIGELRSVGCAILFVSHSLDQVNQISNRCLFLDAGEMLGIGRSQLMVEQYQHFSNANPDEQKAIKNRLMALRVVDGCGESSGMEKQLEENINFSARHDSFVSSSSAVEYQPNGAVIKSVRLLDMAGQEVSQLYTGQKYRCVYRAQFTQDAENVRYAVLIKTPMGGDLGGAMSAPCPAEGVPHVSAGTVTDVEFEFDNKLNPGSYHMNVAVFGSKAGVEFAHHGIINALTFRVVANGVRSSLAYVNFDFRTDVHLKLTGNPMGKVRVEDKK